MTISPEENSENLENPPPSGMIAAPEPQPEDTKVLEPREPLPELVTSAHWSSADTGDASLLFQQFLRPEIPKQIRIPHMGHVGILALLALCGLAIAALIARAAVYYRLFGVTTITEAATEIHYTLGTEGIFYLLTLGGCLLVFPSVWHKGLFRGLQWRLGTALKQRNYLISAAVVCFILAMLDGWLMPGPSDAPIDRIFRMPGAAWILFGFGVTVAPFFEELAFRGFLLPALCTAFDWIAEKVTHEPPHLLDENDHPQWSTPAMVVAAILTSILFAFMHADQTGYSIGPFLLLIIVSLVLCWARLSTRSLAASIMVHACYNFLLFSFMFLGTGGFRHLDNM
jgi:membrane protease YdiL (CAAX protease family)